MNIHFTKGNRPNKPFIMSVEDKSILPEGETQFQSQHTSPLVSRYDCVCTQQVYDAIKDNVGTLEAPALIANALSQPYPDRQNVYIENGSLNLLAQ